MYLEITFGNKADYKLRFKVLDTPIAKRWLERMEKRNAYPLDDRKRFYKFNSYKQEKLVALTSINETIDTINSYKKIITKKLTSTDDQDTLNYLHHIFEVYHGGLDKQDHEFWLSAPDKVQKALAKLNIDVHRCEGLAGAEQVRQPRFVCTWFGMPKTEKLPMIEQFYYGEKGYRFGGVYLKYTEIGKPCLDLAKDNDHYIADDMFKPFTHLSADFDVRFYSNTEDEQRERFQVAENYFNSRRDFFEKFNIYTSEDARISPFVFRVAQLDYESGEEQTIIDNLSQRQYVQDVKLI